MDRFAESIGLPGAPKIRFLGRGVSKQQKNTSHTVSKAQEEIQTGQRSGHSDSSDSGSEADGDENKHSDDELIGSADDKPLNQLAPEKTAKARTSVSSMDAVIKINHSQPGDRTNKI